MTKKDDLLEDQEKRFAVAISQELFQEIEKIVYLNKKTRFKSYSKVQWVYEALEEHLNSTDTEEIIRDKNLQIKIPARINDMIEERIKFCADFSPTFSKKKWIVNVLLKKLFSDMSKEG